MIGKNCKLEEERLLREEKLLHNKEKVKSLSINKTINSTKYKGVKLFLDANFSNSK